MQPIHVLDDDVEFVLRRYGVDRVVLHKKHLCRYLEECTWHEIEEMRTKIYNWAWNDSKAHTSQTVDEPVEPIKILADRMSRHFFMDRDCGDDEVNDSRKRKRSPATRRRRHS